MSLLEFRQHLITWSEAFGPQDLINRVLNKPQKFSLTHPSIVGQLRDKIENLLFENANNFCASDINALINLKKNIRAYKIWVLKVEPQSLAENKEILSTLKKTIKSSINTLHQKFDSKIGSPPSTLSVHKPSDNENLAYLILKKNISKSKIKGAIQKIKLQNIWDFILDISYYYNNNKCIFRKLIHTFFLYATPLGQKYFFTFITSNDDVVSDIILALPTNLTHLNLTQCISLKDFHIAKIAERLKNLRILNLTNCKNLTEEAALILAKMNLKDLNLNGVSQDLVAKVLALNITPSHISYENIE